MYYIAYISKLLCDPAAMGGMRALLFVLLSIIGTCACVRLAAASEPGMAAPSATPPAAETHQRAAKPSGLQYDVSGNVLVRMYKPGSHCPTYIMRVSDRSIL